MATFLAEGMVAGQPAIVIATPAHRAAIVEHLRGKSIDCGRAIREGNLLLLDAQETLDLFMIGDEPHATVFFDNVGRLIEQALNGRKMVLRAYGEMVDVLWRAGKSESAIKLEMLWNRLAVKYRFSLLCGYSLGNFYKQPDGMLMVSAHHSHVVSDPGGSSTSRRAPRNRLRSTPAGLVPSGSVQRSRPPGPARFVDRLGIALAVGLPWVVREQ